MDKETKQTSVGVTFRSPKFSYKGKVHISAEVEARANEGDIEAQTLVLELVKKKSSIVSVEGLTEEELQAINAWMPGQKPAVDSDKESLSEMVDSLTGEAAELKQKVSDLETEKEMLEASNGTLREQISALASDKSSLESKVADLEAQVKELTEKASKKTTKKEGGDHA
jgi:chromosome segregation ATPase